jgi:hypothetical protein
MFGLLYVFNYISLTYGKSLYNGVHISLIAFAFAFGCLITGDIIEQSILKKVKAGKELAEHTDRMTTLDNAKKLDTVSEQLAEILG